MNRSNSRSWRIGSTRVMPERVRHDRAGRAAPALGRDPPFLGEPHEVPADEEELGEAGPLDDVELVGEPLDDRRRQRVVAAAGARPAQLRQVRERRLPVGHREAREAVAARSRGRRSQRRGDLDRASRSPRARPRRASAGSQSTGERRQLRRRTSGTTRRWVGAGRPACRASGRAGSPPARPGARGPRPSRSGRRW